MAKETVWAPELDRDQWPWTDDFTSFSIGCFIHIKDILSSLRDVCKAFSTVLAHGRSSISSGGCDHML